VGEIAGIANSNYNALESSLRKRFSHGLSFLASYTHSKSIDDVSSINITGSASQPVAGENDLAQNPFDLAAERSRSMFDARHRLVLSYQWSVPFWQQAHRWYGRALGNWQFNGILTLMSGTPFTVFDSTDVSLQGSAPEISGFSSNRPNLVGDPNAGPHTPQEWLNKSAFRQVVPDANSPVQQFGNEGRNVVHARTRIRRLGFFRSQEYPRGRGKGIPVPGRAVQFPEPHQFATPQQRYNVADVRRNPL